MLTILLNRNGVPPELNMEQAKGVNLSILVLHMFTSVVSCTPEQELYPLSAIITNPGQVAVSTILFYGK